MSDYCLLFAPPTAALLGLNPESGLLGTGCHDASDCSSIELRNRDDLYSFSNASASAKFTISSFEAKYICNYVFKLFN